MENVRFTAIEGVIGSGKTSLAKLLADQFHAGTIAEKFEDNPFLEKFYSDPKKYAFHTQLYLMPFNNLSQNLQDLFTIRCTMNVCSPIFQTRLENVCECINIFYSCPFSFRDGFTQRFKINITVCFSTGFIKVINKSI